MSGDAICELALTSIGNLSQVTAANDNVFGDNSSVQVAQMTPAFSGNVAAGYTGALPLGVPA